MTARAIPMLVTPEWANEQLDKHNTRNRRLRKWWAEALAQAIRRGEWVFTHQGIAFTTDGQIIDGQHRLLAVVLANIPVEMFVFYDIPNEAFQVIDIGQKRSVSDTTGLDKKTAEVCRLAAQLVFGGTISPGQVSRVAESGLLEIHSRLLQCCGTAKTVYTTAASRLAACVLVMDGHSEDYIFGLYRKLALSDLGFLPDVAYAFIKQVESKKVVTTGMSGSQDTLARALKLYNPQNKGLTKIQVGKDDIAPALAFVRRVIRRASVLES